VSAGTRLLAVLGEPVEHSLSPVIQNAALRACGLDGVYLALRCRPGALSGLLRGLADAGGAGNVTLPHKAALAELLDDATEAVLRTGACNTFWAGERGLHGDNTDVEGFRRALHALVGTPAGGLRVLLLGAGGAARAAALALLEDGVRELNVWNRTPGRARDLARHFSDARVRVLESRGGAGGRGYDVVVNATRLGLSDADPLPLEPEQLGRAGAALDLVYGLRPTRFVRAARSAGVSAADGAEMLIQQGAVAFERWWGRPAPLEVMRAALSEARRS
jgi:shikimate dehydrogenase